MDKVSKMKVLFVAAEASPFAKVGGLADVAGALPAALRRMGVDARLIMPCYQQTMDNPDITLVQAQEGLNVNLADSPCYFSVKTSEANGVPVYLLDMPYYFHRDNVYGFNDDPDRFIAFSKGVLAFLKVSNWAPDLVHCNDWQTALVPALLGTEYRDNSAFNRLATVFSIHNLAFQGVVSSSMLERIGMDFSEFNHHKLEFFGQLNFMKGGIYYSDRICTVSPTYANEILTEEYGEQLDGMLRAHKHKLSGIINGIDIHEFNPATDPHISTHFSEEDPSGKTKNKAGVLKEMGLKSRADDMQAPLIGMVTRLTDQKGLDILMKSLEDILKRNIRLVVLGSGDLHYEDAIQDVAKRFPDKMAITLGFDEGLARRIYAGSDMFLMPSRYEPCGLGQMIAMRYGSAPIVRATGGLADTVSPFDPSTLRGNGFVFQDCTSTALSNAVFEAVELYHANNNAWQSLVTILMKQDFTWDSSARKYIALYEEAMQAHQNNMEVSPHDTD